MARTKKTDKIEKPVWLKYTEDEVKKIIWDLAEKGFTAEKIGLYLRDQYGIPKAKLYNLKISKVIKEKKDFAEPSLINLQKKVGKIEEHYKKNKQDKKAERSLIILKAKLKKTRDYVNRKKE
jgi:ribosomal protein S15P/S13E